MRHILTLCIGNICRSPLAEALLARELPGHSVTSAGLGAVVGAPADPFSLEIAAEQGLDLSAHRARQVSQWMCQQAELILVMEQAHKLRLEQQFPLVRGKVFRLGQFGQPGNPAPFDVADPYREPRAAFEAAWAAIAGGVASWVPRIRQIG